MYFIYHETSKNKKLSYFVIKVQQIKYAAVSFAERFMVNSIKYHAAQNVKGK